MLLSKCYWLPFSSNLKYRDFVTDISANGIESPVPIRHS